MKVYIYFLRKKIAIFIHWIVLKHSIFTLPFIFVHLIFNFKNSGNYTQIIYILLAFFFARNVAMSSNRILDFYWDKKNLRTKNRYLISGGISFKEAYIFISINIFFFMLVSLQIHWIYFLLSPFYLILLIVYSFFKRFTMYSHFYLGFIISFSLLLSTFIVYEDFLLQNFLLFIAILFWLAGFDMLYAHLDIAFDKKNNLYSIPSVLGSEKTFYFFYFCSFITYSSFIFIGHLTFSLHFFYYIALGIILYYYVRIVYQLYQSSFNNILDLNLRIPIYYFLGVFLDFYFYNFYI